MRASLASLSLLLAACATPPAPPGPAPSPAPAAAAAAPVTPAAPGMPGALGRVAGRGERLLVYVPVEGDTVAGVAARFLGDAGLAWQVAEANGQRWQLQPGAPVVVPLVPHDPLGVTADGVQAIPILCYHRFGSPASKMVVAPAQFEAQLDWLARNHYRVLRLADVSDFLAGRRALPVRSVVITIDDGYESAYRHAYPLLKKFGFPATLFVPTDFIGARDALSWAQLDELARSGLVDIQAHSKTHRNLVVRADGETEAAHRLSIDNELRQPRTVLDRRLGGSGVDVRHFAYPFGAADASVLDAMQRQPYELGLTVNPGGNAFYAAPLLLRRTMIFGDNDLEAFKARLQGPRGGTRP